jgi:hypothetical protein
MAMMHGLTPADEDVFLRRLADASGKSLKDVRAQWDEMTPESVNDIALKRAVWFFKRGRTPSLSPNLFT